MDYYGALRRGGVETYGLVAVQHDTDDNVAAVSHLHAIVGDGRAVPTLC